MSVPPSIKAPSPHPTDFLPSRPTVPNFNFKAYGALDRGMNPLGGTGPSAHQAFKGVHSWLPGLFNFAGSYMGLPGVSAGGPFGRAPGFTHAGHGPTPLLEQAGQAARGMGGNAGGPDGLLNALNAYIASSQLGIPSVDLH